METQTVSIKVQFQLLHFQKLCEQYVSPIKHNSEVCDKEIRNCKTMYHYFCICKFPCYNGSNKLRISCCSLFPFHVLDPFSIGARVGCALFSLFIEN